MRVSSFAIPSPIFPQAAVRRYISSPASWATGFQVHRNFPKKIKTLWSPPAFGQLPSRLLMKAVFSEIPWLARTGNVLHRISTVTGGKAGSRRLSR
jgi:hypothetical protein